MRNRERGAIFKQSCADFPQMVKLGEKLPSFGLHRFKQGLLFVPSDDEGFTLRGNKQRLLYKGRRRSHRFTILGDGSFEYDCILLKEPSTNTISLRMEGAENYDFLRQPDFVKNPFLKGSYAVYKKKIMVGEGTGKLCHIHRPEIIDARGRRCWGSLAVIGNELRITIPENWLSEAAYPVVVDPTIGTTTVGAFWEDYINFDEEDWEDDEFGLYFSWEMAVNRYYCDQVIQGRAEAFYYSREYYINDTYPALYNGSFEPETLVSENERKLPLYIPGLYEGWHSTTFDINFDPDDCDDYVWFGFATNEFAPRYDYGSPCYVREAEVYYGSPFFLPEDFYDRYTEIYDLKLSMYFTYNHTSQNYVRTLTQRVRLPDSRKIKEDYKRTATQTLKVTSVLSKAQTFFRQCLISVSNTMRLDRIRGFLRSVFDRAGLFEEINHIWEITRKCTETAGIQTNKKQKQDFSREITDNDNVSDYRKLTADYIREIYQTVQGITTYNAFVFFFRRCLITVSNTMRLGQIQVFLRSVISRTGIQEKLQNRREIARRCKEKAENIGEVNRSKGFIREIFDNLTGTDNNDFNILFVRTVNETQGITDSIHKWGDYFRGLYIEVGSIAETRHEAEYYRLNKDTLQAAGSALRSLGVIIRIVSRVLFRDYLLSRFLKAKSELILKSCVVRKIHLESRIN